MFSCSIMRRVIADQQAESRESSLPNVPAFLFSINGICDTMKHEKQDRRSQKTRQLLRDALVELLLEKRYSEVTVQTLLERANVGRSTFYAHYLDKDDLLTSEMAHILEQFDAHTFKLDANSETVLPSLALFQHVQANQRLIQAIVWGRGTEMALNDFQTHLTRRIEQRLSALSSDGFPEYPPRAVVARVIANIFLTLLRWWFETGLRHTPEVMDEMFQRMVMPSVQALLKEQKS